MRNILCPTDFSETADHAIAYAASFAKAVGAKLTLLNVQSVFSLPPVEVIKGKFLATDPVRERLEEKSYQIMKDFKITCLSEVEPSNKRVSDSIADRSKDFDLIIMGTLGVRDLFEFFFGGRAYQVAKESSTPILLIPEGYNYRDISSIVYAFDYEGEMGLPMKQASIWVKALASKITILQVKEHCDRKAEINLQEIQNRIQAANDAIDIKFETIFSDELTQAINSFVLRSKANALALCSKDHNILKTFFHESVIKEFSFTATYPILVIHE